MDTENKTLDFVRDYLGKDGIIVPPTLPDRNINNHSCFNVRRSGIVLVITDFDCPPVRTLQMSIKIGKECEEEFAGIEMSCEEEGRLNWSVTVHHSAPKHFSHFRGHFLPHYSDTCFGLNLPHDESKKWLDRLIKDFLSYVK